MSAESGIDEGRRLVVFHLGDEEYGVPITLVQEIIRHTPPRPVPGSAPHVQGVINLRGRIIPVIDLRSRFGIAGDRPADAKVVITTVDGVTIGVVVDEVREVLTLGADVFEPAPAGTDADGHVEAVAKLDGRLVVVLDLVRLLHEGALAA
ncbi:chemotaxis protein CheW [Miltoncostaea oceani]|uniref:chemotaxis protein CheW n=1 Tax=Miltoncostaea oceani TaxID=2843216 RepID=UPI001C3C570D|nr:chemotaxis protein CheW [Miltoncostaea oceani]